ncbi:MAG: cation transporter [Verrucomicrobia bacterium]|nr:cation transporter [Verrucomicrobiota bacterium]
MMVIEIAAGVMFGSMAMLADRWRMSMRVAAFLITALAYHCSRRHASDPRCSFGTEQYDALDVPCTVCY